MRENAVESGYLYELLFKMVDKFLLIKILLAFNICRSYGIHRDNSEDLTNYSEDAPNEIGKYVHKSDASVPEANSNVRIKREAVIMHNDTNDYRKYPPCGDLPMRYKYLCFCGNATLNGRDDLRYGDSYCCVPSSSQPQCEYADHPSHLHSYDVRYSSVICKNGEVKQKSQPCNKQCYNPYRFSKKLYKTASMYCQEEDSCLPVDQVCSGFCKKETAFCSSQETLRCFGDGYSNSYYKS